METVYIQYYNSPLGSLVLGDYGGRLCFCDWKNNRNRSSVWRKVLSRLKARTEERSTDLTLKTVGELEEYFAGRRQSFDIPLFLCGTDFQKLVWNALCAMNYGETITYQQLAERIGRAKAVRAVGAAARLNVLSIVVPCHRVMGAGGKLTGYVGGLEAKRALLRLENANPTMFGRDVQSLERIEDSEIWREMMSGKPYHADNARLVDELNRVKLLVADYNLTKPTDRSALTFKIKKLLGSTGENIKVIQPFYCDYGRNIHVGENFFANFGMTILDEARVSIGRDAFIGPNVNIYTACHPTDPKTRNKQIEWSLPVEIGDNVWIGGNVTILPGVTVGSGVTIGAGSVVVKDVPDNVVVVGNPAKIVKRLKDKKKRK